MTEQGLWKHKELTRKYVAETFTKKIRTLESKQNQGSLWKTSNAVIENCRIIWTVCYTFRAANQGNFMWKC